ncbi:hypothetical protein VIGAN_06037100, partial [Vigna angularis var. angularis]
TKLANASTMKESINEIFTWSWNETMPGEHVNMREEPNTVLGNRIHPLSALLLSGVTEYHNMEPNTRIISFLQLIGTEYE